MEPVTFIPIPHSDIEQMAFRRLSADTKSEKTRLANKEYSIGITMLIIAFIAMIFYGIIGIIAIIIAAIAGIAGAFTLLAGLLVVRDIRPDDNLLLGTTHNLRNASKGNCPVCKNKITVDDSVTSHDFECSFCNGNLHVDNYQVTAR